MDGWVSSRMSKGGRQGRVRWRWMRRLNVSERVRGRDSERGIERVRWNDLSSFREGEGENDYEYEYEYVMSVLC
jgi:hypothetical protein